MKIGINLVNFGPGFSVEHLSIWARTAESLGYHGIFISDHVAITRGVSQVYPEPFFDPFATLSWLAGQTSRVQLGMTVCVLPYRHPVLVARLGANIDQFSDGRFVFGVGAGWAADEFTALGVSHERRGALTDEGLEAILALWNGSGYVDFHGALVSFDDVSAISTRQQPRPPLWIGGAGLGRASLHRAARFGDAWHPILSSLDGVADSLDIVRRHAHELGRAELAFAPRINIDVRETSGDGPRRLGTGSVEQVRGDLAQLESFGASYVVLDWNSRDLEATRDHERGLMLFSTLAEQVIDLQNESLR